MMTLQDMRRRVRRRYGPRRFRAYGVGPGKTGTHSLSNIFAQNYRSAHEPEAARTLEVLLALREGRATDRDVRAHIRDRDRRLRLEMDCAGYYAFLARYLADEYPDAKFVLTIRDCFTWANSAMNQLLNNAKPGGHWLAWRNANFGRLEDCRYGAEESVLAERGMWSLDRVLHVWADHYRAVLDHVPEDRIFVLLIDDIGRRNEDLAGFIGNAGAPLTQRGAKAFKAPRDHGLLAQLPEDFVDRRARETCGDLMERFFPGVPCEYRSHVASSV